MKKKSVIIIFIATAVLLLIPFIAMQIGTEVNWSIGDFLIAAFLLLATGFAIDFVVRRITRKRFRIIFVCAIVLILLVVWAELAVGLLENLLTS